MQTHIRCQKHFRNTFKHYLSKLIRNVELNIFRSVSNCFALIFNGQQTPAAYHIALFDVFPTTNQMGYQSVCLVFLTLMDEIKMESGSRHGFQLAVKEILLKEEPTII